MWQLPEIEHKWIPKVEQIAMALILLSAKQSYIIAHAATLSFDVHRQQNIFNLCAKNII